MIGTDLRRSSPSYLRIIVSLTLSAVLLGSTLALPRVLEDFYETIHSDPRATVKLKLQVVPHAGLHSFPTEDVTVATPLLEIPRAHVITLDEVRRDVGELLDQLLGSSEEDDDGEDNSSDLGFLLYMIYHLHQGSSSPWHNYFQLAQTMTSPLYYSSEEWDRFEGTLGSFLRMRNEEANGLYSALFPMLCQEYPDDFPECDPDVTLKLFKRAYSIVNSRLLPTHKIVVPHLDLINVVPDPSGEGNTFVEVQKDGSVVVAATESLSDSDALTLGVGFNKSDVDLLWDHGLTMPPGSNEHNYCIVQLDRSKLTTSQIHSLTKEGISPSLTFLIRRREYPINALRALDILEPPSQTVDKDHPSPQAISLLITHVEELLSHFSETIQSTRDHLRTDLERSKPLSENERNILRINLGEQEILSSMREDLLNETT